MILDKRACQAFFNEEAQVNEAISKIQKLSELMEAKEAQAETPAGVFFIGDSEQWDLKR